MFDKVIQASIKKNKERNTNKHAKHLTNPNNLELVKGKWTVN